MFTLGIETSCDETAVAVVEDEHNILSNEVSSSVELHKAFGGIIPEIAGRCQVEYILYVLDKALSSSRISLEEIGLIAVTKGPGLVGSLLVGLQAAKALALSCHRPLIGVNHLAGHIVSVLMAQPELKFPFIGLVVSGGHTTLVQALGFDQYELLGLTRDDAGGEAFDKVAKILGLGYPGGPEIERIARRGNPEAVKFKCGEMEGSLDFSFSGIKTAVLNFTSHQSRITSQAVSDIAASFQETVVNDLVAKCVKALRRTRLRALAVGGGVSINKRLQDAFNRAAGKYNFRVFFPESSLTQDNAAMVAGLGFQLYKKGYQDSLDLAPEANLTL